MALPALAALLASDMTIEEILGEGAMEGLGLTSEAEKMADDPMTMAGVFSSPIMAHKLKLATKEINEILSRGETLTDSDIGRIAAKHELPGDAVRSIREFANAEELRKMRAAVPVELPPLPDEVKVAEANKAAAQTDVL